VKNYLLLCGGVGGAKLALGFKEILSPENLGIVVNTGDDFTHLNLKICPDLDTVMYTLSGESDVSKGWGRKNETWNMLSALSELDGETWFQLGDKDLATHIHRTKLLQSGYSLQEATSILSKLFNLPDFIYPMSNESVETYVQTKNRLLSFQEYFVKLQCKPPVTDFVFKGLDAAEFNHSIDLDAFEEIVICPSNPFVSINPMLQLNKLQQHLINHPEKVTVISPIVNLNSLKGPTAKMMTELGQDVNVQSIAKFYKNYSKRIFIDSSDQNELTTITHMGFEVCLADLIMNNFQSKVNLAQTIVDHLEES